MRIFLVIAVTLIVSGCASQGPSDEYLQSLAAVAVSNPARSEVDRQLDAKRKPAEVLGFFRTRPGMKVLDVFGGGGYYTEILSYLVGDSGAVTLYNNNPWNQFVKDQVAARLKDNRLPNASALTVEPEGLGQVTEQYDAAIFILGMHDIYYEDNANGWPAIDVRAFLLDIHRLIRPGGILGIIDHNAQSGSDPEIVGKTLHRVDPARVISDLEAIGFSLEAKSNILRNPGDDLTGLVFAKELRWQTDRSVLRFRRK
ncbi:MAG: class I SAM-dependent methyltransferase [Gammaproteobacteria bacterium]|nr:class I SAM-dependent methyltransferase [Gammaproteobacteria bacterium]MBT7370133.1 class I SAM-dependent methyltransferase [Gammaproteobacteria bacterium]